MPECLSLYNVVLSKAIRQISRGRGNGDLLLFYNKSLKVTILDISPWWIIVSVSKEPILFILVSLYFKPSLKLDAACDIFQILLTDMIEKFVCKYLNIV